MALVVGLIGLPIPTLAQTPDLDTLWQIVQDQQREIDALKQALTNQSAANTRLETRVAEQNDTLQVQQQRLVQTEQMADAFANSPMEEGAAADWSLGGYGEMHYNNLDNGEEIDFHRFVLFVGHQFTDTLSFYSELEVEHSIAGDGKVGEVEVEQAFVQWDYSPDHRAKVGLFLLPVGLLNETHEPDTFYGVERNAVEAQIVPSTWWEGGAALSGDIAPGWGYDLAVHSGLRLDTDNASASRRSSIRSARQKVGEANANSLAYTARLSFSGIPGIQWNTSLQYQSDLTQGDADGIGIGDIDGVLFETNVNIRRGAFGFRALYAQWTLDSGIELLNAGADEQTGWLIEPSLRLADNMGVFARYSSYDLTAGSSATSSDRNQLSVGLNYWLHDNVVLKLDFQRQDNDSGTDVDGFNLGFGYSF